MPRPTTPSDRTRPASAPSRADRARALWVPAVLFACAAILALEPLPLGLPVPPATPVPDWAIDPTPVERPRLRPEYRMAGFDYRCSDCHRIIPSPPETDRVLTQHREIDLAHGINTRCFNCHHRANRDAFAGDGQAEIPWSEPQRLCAKCHGPVYRDWQHGSHGRTNGYWDASRGPQIRRRCIECHNPHRPSFRPMAPAPPPNTLRMGPQGEPAHAHSRDPLRLGPPPARPGPHVEPIQER